MLFEKISKRNDEFNEISSIISLVDRERFAVFLLTKSKVIKLVELYMLLSDQSHCELRDIQTIINGLKEDDLVDIIEEPISREEGELANNILQKQLPLLKENTDVIRRISIAIINCRDEKLRMGVV